MLITHNFLCCSRSQIQTRNTNEITYTQHTHSYNSTRTCSVCWRSNQSYKTELHFIFFFYVWHMYIENSSVITVLCCFTLPLAACRPVLSMPNNTLSVVLNFNWVKCQVMSIFTLWPTTHSLLILLFSYGVQIHLITQLEPVYNMYVYVCVCMFFNINFQWIIVLVAVVYLLMCHANRRILN